jgi:hypothetical protein
LFCCLMCCIVLLFNVLCLVVVHLMCCVWLLYHLMCCVWLFCLMCCSWFCCLMCWYLVVLLFVLHFVVLLFNVLCLLTVFEFHNGERSKCRCADVSVILWVCIHLAHLTCKVCRYTKHINLKKPNCQVS